VARADNDHVEGFVKTHKLFSDAEGGEYLRENVFGRRLPGYFAEKA
jgi:hypothetical protein